MKFRVVAAMPRGRSGRKSRKAAFAANARKVREWWAAFKTRKNR